MMIRHRRRRRTWAVVLLILLGILLLSLIGDGIRAAANDTSSEEAAALGELQKNIEELLDSLDTKELQEYLSTLSAFKGVTVKEKLLGIITGDYSLDYSSLAQAVLSLVWEEGKVMLPAFVVIVAVALLCGILNSAKSGFMNSTMSDIIHFFGYISVGASVLACLVSVLDVGFSALSSMQRQMEIVYPLLLTLMAASGGTVSAGIYRPAVAFFSSAICELFTSVVLPTSVVVIILAFVGNLSEDVRTERLGEFFKSINKWLIGLTLGLFSVLLTVQGIAGAQYDGLSLRAVKYVVSG